MNNNEFNPIFGLAFIALGISYLPEVITLALSGNRSPNFWILAVSSLVVIASGVYTFLVVGKGNLTVKSSSKIYSACCLLMAIGSSLSAVTKYTNGDITLNYILLFTLPATAILLFIGYKFWPKK